MDFSGVADCFALDAECFSAAADFLEEVSKDCLDGMTDLGEDFTTGVSATFLLGPLLFVVAGDGLDDDTVDLDGLVLGFESVLSFDGFLVVESLEPSFSSSFLGEVGFLEVISEPGRGEAVHRNIRLRMNMVLYV